MLCTCSFNPDSAAEENICLNLPAWPPEDSLSSSYPPLSRWAVTITSGEKQSSFYTREKTITVKTKKNRPFCLLAQPVTKLYDDNECSYFMPAGFIYPAGNFQALSATSICWEEGFLAQVMQTVFNEGLAESLSPVEIEYIVSTFNWKKAQETINKKISADSKLFYNPWLLSKSRILEGITSQAFKASYLNVSGTIAIEASILPDKVFLSSYIPENQVLSEKKQFTALKNTPLLISDAQKYGIFITYKSSKNISLEFIYLPIYIEDI